MRASLAVMFLLLAVACNATDAVPEVCDAARSSCPQLRRLVSSPARINGPLQFSIEYTPLVTDTTLWRVDVLVRNEGRDTVVVTPTGSQACEGYIVVGFWDNATYTGRPKLTFPASRRDSTYICFAEPNDPEAIPPGATFVNLRFRRTRVTDSYLRWVTDASELWPAMLVSSDRGDVVVTAPPRRIRP